MIPCSLKLQLLAGYLVNKVPRTTCYSFSLPLEAVLKVVSPVEQAQYKITFKVVGEVTLSTLFQDL